MESKASHYIRSDPVLLPLAPANDKARRAQAKRMARLVLLALAAQAAVSALGAGLRNNDGLVLGVGAGGRRSAEPHSEHKKLGEYDLIKNEPSGGEIPDHGVWHFHPPPPP